MRTLTPARTHTHIHIQHTAAQTRARPQTHEHYTHIHTRHLYTCHRFPSPRGTKKAWPICMAWATQIQKRQVTLPTTLTAQPFCRDEVCVRWGGMLDHAEYSSLQKTRLLRSILGQKHDTCALSHPRAHTHTYTYNTQPHKHARVHKHTNITHTYTPGTCIPAIASRRLGAPRKRGQYAWHGQLKFKNDK